MSDVSESLILLTKISDHERFAQVAQRKWAMWVNRSFAHFLTKNEWFARKSNERIPSPANIPIPIPIPNILIPIPMPNIPMPNILIGIGIGIVISILGIGIYIPNFIVYILLYKGKFIK